MTINSPRAMLERLAFVCFLGLAVGSFVLTGHGLIAGLAGGDPRLAGLGIAGLLLLAVLRSFGYRHLHFRECAESFEFVEQGLSLIEDPAREARAQALQTLLDSLEARQRSGDPAPDVWEVQRLRHEASALLAADPALRQNFAAELAAHPELG